jgi:hypothetical protein
MSSLVWPTSRRSVVDCSNSATSMLPPPNSEL